MKLTSGGPRIASGALTVVLCAATAAAQDPIYPLVVEGDAIPNVGLVTDIFEFNINDKGVWLVVADTDCPNLFDDCVLLENGVVIHREGDPLPEPLGTTILTFQEVSINSFGDHACSYQLLGTVPPILDEAIYFENQLLLLAGTDAVFPQFGFGTKYITFLDVFLNDANQLLVNAEVDDPNIPGNLDPALLIYEVDSLGNMISSSILWKQGDILPGQFEPVDDFGANPNALAFNNLGDVLFFADLVGNTDFDDVIYLNATLLAQEGLPSPIKFRNWETFYSCTSVALNNMGDYVYKGELDGDPATKGLIVKNGDKFVQTGDTLFDIQPFVLTSFGDQSPLFIDDDGHVLWWGEWSDPNTSKNSGLFIDHELIVWEGMAKTTTGLTITAINTGPEDMSWSWNHRHLMFKATLETGQVAALLIELPIDPTNYCVGKINSLGCQPAMMAMGTPSMTAATPFLLNATQLMNQSIGILAYGYAEAETPFYGGTLCIAPPVSRGPAMTTGGNPPIPPDCSGALTLDFNALAQSGVDPQLFAGKDVYTQYWSRDAFDLFGVSLTDAVKFTLLP